MNREQASKGFHCVSDTSAHAKHFYGFTVVAEAVVSAIVAPTATGPDGVSYNGDESGLAGLTALPVGYYPVRGSSITLTSGELILWLE